MMKIFQLMVYSCVSTSSLDGDLMSMICRWDQQGYYATKELAERDGDKSIGMKIHSFIGEDRKIQKFKVQEISVIDQ